MSLKTAIGIKSHREDPKMFWFELALVSLLLWLATLLAGLAHPTGVPGIIISVVRGLAPCWLLLCAMLTWVAAQRIKAPLPRKQRFAEGQIFVLTAVLSLLAELLRQVTGGFGHALTVTLSGLAVSLIFTIAQPKLGTKKRFTTPEILRIVLLGVFACVFLARFFATAAEVLPKLVQ